jgi:acyl-CoA thioesterase-1
VRILILAIGANDGMRGLPITELKRNLLAMVTTAQARGVRVLLVGMEIPPNLGPEYALSFRQVFHHLAQEQQVAGFLPFLLDGVAGQPRFNQGDSIHPNALGTRMVAENVWQALEPMLGQATLTPDRSPRGRAGASR